MKKTNSWSEVIDKNWSFFAKGFAVRATSPMVLGFAVIMYLLSGVQAAGGFIAFVGVLGGLKTLRRKTIQGLRGA